MFFIFRTMYIELHLIEWKILNLLLFAFFFFNCCKKKKELNIFLYGKHYGCCYLNYHLPRNKGKNMTKQEGANV